jgi:hypothetical protein
LGIICALETGERILVVFVATGNDRTQGVEIVVDKIEDILSPLTGIGDNLTDVELGETAL